MQINKAEIVMSAVKPSQYPKTGQAEIALAGRSNVGKSSFINKMIRRKSLARTSSQPGKTQTINFYNLDDKLYFVDVPGYGYARTSKSHRQSWVQMMDAYFSDCDALKLTVLLVDARHEASPLDLQMFDYLMDHERPTVIVATKADKVKSNQLYSHLEKLAEDFGLEDPDDIVVFSSETGEGTDEMWEIIRDFI